MMNFASLMPHRKMVRKAIKPEQEGNHLKVPQLADWRAQIFRDSGFPSGMVSRFATPSFASNGSASPWSGLSDADSAPKSRATSIEPSSSTRRPKPTGSTVSRVLIELSKSYFAIQQVKSKPSTERLTSAVSAMLN